MKTCLYTFIHDPCGGMRAGEVVVREAGCSYISNSVISSIDARDI
ncbi:MAG: hypothetical protein ACPG77_15210 [Nannocystaceae bacterium]